MVQGLRHVGEYHQPRAKEQPKRLPEKPKPNRLLVELPEDEVVPVVYQQSSHRRETRKTKSQRKIRNHQSQMLKQCQTACAILVRKSMKGPGKLILVTVINGIKY